MIAVLRFFVVGVAVEDFYYLKNELVSNAPQVARDVAKGLEAFTPRVWDGPVLVPDHEQCRKEHKILITGCSGSLGSNVVLYLRRVVPASTLICIENNADKKKEMFIKEWFADRNVTRTRVQVYSQDLSQIDALPALMKHIGTVDYAIFTSAVMLKGSKTDYEQGDLMFKINTVAPYVMARHLRMTGNTRVVVFTSRAAEIRYDACDPESIANPRSRGKYFGTWTWYGCTKRILDVAMLQLASDMRTSGNELMILHPGSPTYKKSENMRGTKLLPIDGFQDFKNPPSTLDLLIAAGMDGTEHACTTSVTVISYLFSTQPVNGIYSSMQIDLVREVRSQGPQILPPKWRPLTEYHWKVMDTLDKYRYLHEDDYKPTPSFTLVHPYAGSEASSSGLSIDACTRTWDTLMSDYEKNAGLVPNVMNRGDSYALAELPIWLRAFV